MALPVRWIDQGDDQSCVPACIKMVLDYLNQEGIARIPEFTLEQLRRILKTDYTGTSPADIRRINRRLSRASHLIEFEFSVGNDLGDIQSELDKGVPVIAWIKVILSERLPSHSVVINDLSKQKLKIGYVDPIDGEETVNLSNFENEWVNSQNALIKVSIRQRPHQAALEEFGDLEENHVGTP